MPKRNADIPNQHTQDTKKITIFAIKYQNAFPAPVKLFTVGFIGHSAYYQEVFT